MADGAAWDACNFRRIPCKVDFEVANAFRRLVLKRSAKVKNISKSKMVIDSVKVDVEVLFKRKLVWWLVF